MPTSNTTDFKSTAAEIITDAFSLINAYGVDETIPSEDYNHAVRVLNRMIKTWQAQGYHLWKRTIGFLFPSENTYEYLINNTVSFTSEFLLQGNNLPAVNGNFSSGSTYITLNSVVGINVDDNIIVTLSDGTFFQDIVDNISSNDVYFRNNVLSGDVTNSAVVYIYNDSYKITDVFDIKAVSRRTLQSSAPYKWQTVLLNPLSWDDFFALPNKGSSSIPNSYSFNRELDFIRFKMWPLSGKNTPIIEILYYSKAKDIDANSNNLDFLQEWEEAVVLHLAIRLAPQFGKLQSANYLQLKQQADDALDKASSFDRENTSVFFSPSRF